MFRFTRLIMLGVLAGALFLGSAFAASKKQPRPTPPKSATQDIESGRSQTDRTSTDPAERKKEQSHSIQSGNSAPAGEVSGKTPFIKSLAPSTVRSDDATPPKEDEPLAEPAPASPNVYEVNWQSINAGGQSSTSPSYDVISSAGQAAIGEASSASYNVGVGYVYGLGISCDCSFQCDYDSDGFLTSLDLGSLIDVLFAGFPEQFDPLCPTSRGDFDCDGFPTSLDLGNLIDHLFAGGPPPCNPCVD